LQTITVKDFETAGELDQTAWRFLTLEKFISLLEFYAIWFSRLGTLQKLDEQARKPGAGLSFTAVDAFPVGNA
jgi:hypothetical protein